MLAEQVQSTWRTYGFLRAATECGSSWCPVLNPVFLDTCPNRPQGRGTFDRQLWTMWRPTSAYPKFERAADRYIRNDACSQDLAICL